MLKQNIAENLPTGNGGGIMKQRSRKKSSSSTQQAPRIDTLELDWEADSVSQLPSLLGLEHGQGLDFIVACDCIYNEALIEPLNTTCAHICRLRASDQQQQQQTPTICLVAQQLRSPDVFESWLRSFHRLFHTWQVPDALLTEGLRENSGFIVHFGIVR